EQLENRSGLVRSFDRAFAADRKSDIVASLDDFQRQALDILRSPRTRDALNLDRETGRVRDRYGRTQFGQACLAACRLVEAGVRFVTVSTGENSWDTHLGNFGALRTLLPGVDQPLSALIQDLGDSGLLDNTIVYCAGEFGRTPRINRNAG